MEGLFPVDPCPLPQRSFVHPPPLSSLGAQYTLVAMAMASQRKIEGIGQERPPPPSATALDPFPPTPTQAQRVGSGRNSGDSEREPGRKDVKDRERR